MVCQTANGEHSTLYAGFIRDISDPIILKGILAKLQNGDVVGEYLNRVIGGAYCRIVPENEINEEWARQDPSGILKATYSRPDLEKRIAELQKRPKYNQLKIAV